MRMTHSLDLIFAALADPTRRSILKMLLEDDMAVTDVAEPFDMSLAAVSKHLRVLTRAGLIVQDRRGRVTWCKLDPDAMAEVQAFVQSFGRFEAMDLDAFEAFLARELTSENEAHDGDDDDNQADEIDDAVHASAPLLRN